MKSGFLRWPLAMGVVIPVVAIGLYLTLNRGEVETQSSGISVDPIITNAAVKRGLDPVAANEGIDLLKKAETAKDLSAADWERTKRLLKNPEPTLASTALGVMMHLRDSDKKKEATDIAHDQRKNAADAHMRRSALILLYHLRAPDWRSEVDAALRSGNPDEKRVAEGILARDSGTKPSGH